MHRRKLGKIFDLYAFRRLAPTIRMNSTIISICVLMLLYVLRHMANFLILAPFPSWIYQEVAEEPPLVFCIGRRGGNKIFAKQKF